MTEHHELVSVADLAALEGVSRMLMRSRLEGSPALRARWAPALVGRVGQSQAPVYDKAVYLRLRKTHGAHWKGPQDTKEE